MQMPTYACPNQCLYVAKLGCVLTYETGESYTGLFGCNTQKKQTTILTRASSFEQKLSEIQQGLNLQHVTQHQRSYKSPREGVEGQGEIAPTRAPSHLGTVMGVTAREGANVICPISSPYSPVNRLLLCLYFCPKLSSFGQQSRLLLMLKRSIRNRFRQNNVN